MRSAIYLVILHDKKQKSTIDHSRIASLLSSLLTAIISLTLEQTAYVVLIIFYSIN